MRHDQDGCAFGCQLLYDLRQVLLGISIESLRRLVKQQNVRISQQELADRKPLRLAAGQIVGMLVQELCQFQLVDHLQSPRLVLFRALQ